jgi:hypothetical protein
MIDIHPTNPSNIKRCLFWNVAFENYCFRNDLVSSLETIVKCFYFASWGRKARSQKIDN